MRRASKGILHTTCPGVSEFPKPPLPGRPRMTGNNPCIFECNCSDLGAVYKRRPPKSRIFKPPPPLVRLYTRYPIVARALGLAAASKGIMFSLYALGRVRRASKGILHTTCPGVSEFPKPPLPGRPRPDFSIFTHFLIFTHDFYFC